MITFALVFVVLLIMRYWLVIVRVVGSSMEPTLKNGVWLLAVRVSGKTKLQRGDIVVVSDPFNYGDACNEYIIKRVYAVERDIVSITLDDYNNITSFGKQLDIVHYGYDNILVRIPDRHIYLSCDGMGYSSKFWGPVDIATVIALVVNLR